MHIFTANSQQYTHISPHQATLPLPPSCAPKTCTCNLHPPWYAVVHVHGISGVSVQVGDDTYRWEDKIDASLHTGESVYHDGSGLLSVNLTSEWAMHSDTLFLLFH